MRCGRAEARPSNLRRRLSRGGFFGGGGLLGSGLLLLGEGGAGALLHEEGFLALATAEIEELRAADLALALDFDLFNAGAS